MTSCKTALAPATKHQNTTILEHHAVATLPRGRRCILVHTCRDDDRTINYKHGDNDGLMPTEGFLHCAASWPRSPSRASLSRRRCLRGAPASPRPAPRTAPASRASVNVTNNWRVCATTAVEVTSSRIMLYEDVQCVWWIQDWWFGRCCARQKTLGRLHAVQCCFCGCGY